MFFLPSSHIDMIKIFSCIFDEVLDEVTYSYLGSNQFYIFSFLSFVNIIYDIFKYFQGNLLPPHFILIAFMNALS